MVFRHVENMLFTYIFEQNSICYGFYLCIREQFPKQLVEGKYPFAQCGNVSFTLFYSMYKLYKGVLQKKCRQLSILLSFSHSYGRIRRKVRLINSEYFSCMAKQPQTIIKPLLFTEIAQTAKFYVPIHAVLSSTSFYAVVFRYFQSDLIT